MKKSYDITVYTAPEEAISSLGLEKHYDDEVEDFVFLKGDMSLDELIAATEVLAMAHAYWTTQVWVEAENPYYVIDLTNATDEQRAEIDVFLESAMHQTGMVNAGDSSVWQQPADKQEGVVLRWVEGEK